MKIHKLLFANHGAAIYATLVIGSGLALALSMPWASRLSELIMQPWSPFPFPFFLIYAMISGVIALSIGAVAAPVTSDMRPFSALLTVLARVAFGHFLMLPLIAYSRVLFPNSAGPLIGAAAYVILMSVMMSVVAMLMEVSAARRGKHSSGHRLVFFFAYLGVPLIGLLGSGGVLRACALVSPVQALASLLSGSASASQWSIGLGVPTLILVGALFALVRVTRGAPSS